jgi:hypothetical protein
MSNSQNVASREQFAANRANAARSPGPRTPAGKARSAQNARKHGFAAANYTVVRLEDLQEVAHLKDDAAAVYQPVNSQEMFAVERIAITQQALLRAARLEAGLFTSCLNEMLDLRELPKLPMADYLVEGIEVASAQNRNFLLFEGLKRNAAHSSAFTLYLRYSAQAERQYRRAVEEFDRLKALRLELPNEPGGADLGGADLPDSVPADLPNESEPVPGPPSGPVGETNPIPLEPQQSECLVPIFGNPPLIPAFPPEPPSREPADPGLAEKLKDDTEPGCYR